ncbi:sensor histidine kinase [Haloactinomyces albus]|uniref:Two-component system sensor histidine kinase DesK n=1 Tax=Haloactinomyces albus TaxID=1352928 RepID=A0AAE3ZDT9_9ACTN|nr:histidine kinase [Haloactinomyces albus]MDR7301372.1 two-component system sensor histidine kinase DesK [Haloactinomyces albus]
MSSAVAEFDPKRVRRLRRYTWWSVVPMAPVYAAIVALSLVNGFTDGTYTTIDLLVLGPVLLVLTTEATRFCTSTMRGLGQGYHHSAEQAIVFVAALLTAGAVLATRPEHGFVWVLIPGILAASIVANAAVRLRWPLTFATCGSTVLVFTAASWRYGPPIVPIRFALLAAVVVAFTIFVLVVAVWFWDVVLELDRARSMSAELAVAQERLRFAAELHDVQGHHLQAIALKGELAERLIGADDGAARAQAAEVAELARTALQETRALVHGYRHSDLGTELDNARGVLEAAGITTTVSGRPQSVAPPLQPLFGALVREGATNVLRHSRALRCEMSIATDEHASEVVLRNDGVHASGDTSGTGIEGLRERFATLGGQVRAEHRDGWFELAGHAEEPRRAEA